MTTNSTNQPHRLHNAYDVQANWPFLKEAMDGLNDKARAGYTVEAFFAMLIKVVGLKDDGLLLMLKSKNGKPLGVGVSFSAMDFSGESCFYVWAAYSNSKCKTTLSELLEHTSEFARARGHKLIKMSTPRINPAADRLFVDTLGFTKAAVVYSKTI